ncbi:MAG: DUF5916 domain-containing protein [Thermoanaerobaculia bacterium]
MAVLAVAGAPVLAHDGGRAEVPSVEAVAIDGPTEPIELDGRLDEAAWRRAEPATGFRQREPRELAPATERTELRVLYTAEALYVGVVAHDREPERIVALEMGRDVGIRRDDGIVLLLDTFHDHRNAYFFETNPNGARTDALISNEGRDANFEWDGVWNAAAARTPEGWSAEIEIPFTTLRFDPALDTWGLQVRRIIRRKNEEVFWSPIPREYGLFRVSRAGHLTGLDGLQPGRNLRVKPFGTFSAAERPGTRLQRADEADGGLDLKWGVGKSFSVDLTYNTDFAETEVDEQRVNLTRFSLFFPEKREFFLENAGIFDFGPGLGGGGAPPLEVFFSRRIGIAPDGRQVPIDVGGRVTGRTGPWNVGLLAVQTDSVASGPALSGVPAPGAIPRQLWGVARVQRNVGERSSLGAIVTRREAAGGGFDQVYGLDADLKPTDRVDGWLFAAANEAPGRSDHAAGAGLEFEGSFWEWEASALEIGADFEPDMGFVLRQGVRRYDAEVEWNPRPGWTLPFGGSGGAVRNLSFNLEGEVYTTTDGELRTVDAQMRLFGVRLDSDDFATLFTQFREERLTEGFEIQPGVLIPAGDYSWQDLGLFVQTAQGRSASFRGFVVAGDFFDGDRVSADVNLTWRPSRYVRTETSWNRNDVSLPTGEFVTDVYRQRLGVSFSPDLVLDSFVQFNEAAELLAANVRLNWIYRPGADLFLVYNETWDAPTLADATSRDRRIILKLTYLFQL